MSSMSRPLPAQLADLVSRENVLCDRLSSASRQLDRVDCFDEEQRAEIYTILKALRDDTAAHCHTLGEWVSDRGDTIGHA